MNVTACRRCRGVDLCLHAAPGVSSAALTHLRQAVVEQAQSHLGRASRKGH